MLPITPERLAAVYECLRAFPPFSRMNLPPSEEVKFGVLRTKKVHGDYTRYVGTDQHILRISTATHHHFNSLAATMAHECIHLYQARAKTETSNTQHNGEFIKIASRVCQIHGWDFGQFI